jgi:hypothetical protein
MAHRRSSGEELEGDCRVKYSSTTLTKPSGCRNSTAWNWLRSHLFFKIANRYTSLGQNNQHLNIELNFFENWYSVVYLIIN